MSGLPAFAADGGWQQSAVKYRNVEKLEILCPLRGVEDESVSYATLVPRRPRIHMSYSGPTVSISIARPINAPAKAIT